MAKTGIQISHFSVSSCILTQISALNVETNNLVGVHLQYCMVSQSRRPKSEQSPLQEPQNLYLHHVGNTCILFLPL